MIGLGATHGFAGWVVLSGAWGIFAAPTTGQSFRADRPFWVVAAQDPNPQREPNVDRQLTEPAPAYSYTTELAASLARLSPFDAASGDRMGGVVPIGDVAEEKRARVRRLWEIVLAPESRPKDDESVEWRVLRWSQVRWETLKPPGKTPTPPCADQYTARWMSNGSPFVVRSTRRDPDKLDSISVTIHLSGDARVQCKYPQLKDLAPDQIAGPVLVKDIDKERLLAVLTGVFRFPWQAVDDFVVTWSPSPTSAGHLRIESARGRKQGDHEAWPNREEQAAWYDDVPLHLDSSGDPQKLTISMYLLGQAQAGEPTAGSSKP